MNLDSDTHRYAGPGWDNSTEYRSIETPEFKADEKTVAENIERIQTVVTSLSSLFETVRNGRSLTADEEARLVRELQAVSVFYEKATQLLSNMHTYVYCEASVDATNTEATVKESQMYKLHSQLEQAAKPWQLFLDSAPETIVEKYLDHPTAKAERFRVYHSRKMSDTRLSEAEEQMIAALAPSGHSAWGELYDSISGHLKCRIQDAKDPAAPAKEIGLAQATGLLLSTDEPTRRQAWLGIQNAWKAQEEPCAAILNALAGWRHDINHKRSQRRKIDFLTEPVHANSIRRETLDVMLDAIRSRIDIPRRALTLVARGLGKPKIDPWDLLAPPPEHMGGKMYPFEEGFDLVARAFDSVDPEMGEFARMMLRNKWIEARVLPNKRQGGYCTSFEKSRTPRIYQTYMGSISDIKTLAHELGHAYHSWVMRDLAPAESEYPSTLAETASIFAETAFDDFFVRTGDEKSRLLVGWEAAHSAAAFMVNIPARFTFEKSFYERRLERSVPAKELSELTDRAWQDWYGDCISQPSSMYWASKLHFAMAGRSFYNFPYSFGYLFSLGIYSQRERLGAKFMATYKAILRDTGRMTAEELIQKHMGEDIAQSAFWLKSIDIVESQIAAFENELHRSI